MATHTTVEELAEFLTGETLRGMAKADPIIVGTEFTLRFQSALSLIPDGADVFEIDDLALDGIQGAGDDIFAAPLSEADARYAAECMINAD